MLRAGGYAEVIGGRGTFVCFEEGGKPQRIGADQQGFDTWTCVHCNGVVHTPTRRKDTDYFFCRNCMARICDRCADHPCIPFMKKVEAQEERARRLQAYGG
jgi:hypothetical protein